MASRVRTFRKTLGGNFFNRELSWLEFNRRVLSEALNTDVPLLERLRFLCITTSNFDEFFMVRVASLKRQLRTGNTQACPSGMSPEEQLKEIGLRVREMSGIKYRCLLEDVLPRLTAAGLVYRTPDSYTVPQRKYLKSRFTEEVFPVLTPVRCEVDRPLPYTGNLKLHAAFLLRAKKDSGLLVADEGRESLAIVQIPQGMPRVIYLPGDDRNVSFALLEHVIQQNADELFPGYEIAEDIFFRVTRDADLGVDEERDEDFVEAMEQILESRENSVPVRLAVDRQTSRLPDILTRSLALDPSDVYVKNGPLDLSTFAELADLPGFDNLRYEAWKPQESAYLSEDVSIWDVLKKRDVLVHHPFEAFSPVVRMVGEAAIDPAVLAIKMTLYRTSGTSPIVQALQLAAENGKQVTVFVELKARFDEEQNIEWAQKLERAGVIVVYGIARLKVHAKTMMVVRREEKGVRRYIHLGTGNYNDRTARLYTDLGLFTANEDLAFEIGLFFNAITGYSAIPAFNRLIMAPSVLKGRLLQLIDREAQRSSAEDPGLIMIKANALADPEVINAFYSASQKGVRIHLIIRGICMLVPGVPGLSDNIIVTSVVDRFLEHSRVYYFHNGGNEEIYLGSADMMPRNLERRVELLFPVENPDLKKRVRFIIDTYARDNVKAHVLQPDGSYRRRVTGSDEPAVRAQLVLHDAARSRASTADPVNRKEFSVRRKPPRVRKPR